MGHTMNALPSGIPGLGGDGAGRGGVGTRMGPLGNWLNFPVYESINAPRDSCRDLFGTP